MWSKQITEGNWFSSLILKEESSAHMWTLLCPFHVKLNKLSQMLFPSANAHQCCPEVDGFSSCLVLTRLRTLCGETPVLLLEKRGGKKQETQWRHTFVKEGMFAVILCHRPRERSSLCEEALWWRKFIHVHVSFWLNFSSSQLANSYRPRTLAHIHLPMVSTPFLPKTSWSQSEGDVIRF